MGRSNGESRPAPTKFWSANPPATSVAARPSRSRGLRFRRTGGRDGQPLPQFRCAASDVEKDKAGPRLRPRDRRIDGRRRSVEDPVGHGFIKGGIVAALAWHLAALAVAER